MGVSAIPVRNRIPYLEPKRGAIACTDLGILERPLQASTSTSRSSFLERAVTNILNISLGPVCAIWSFIWSLFYRQQWPKTFWIHQFSRRHYVLVLLCNHSLLRKDFFANHAIYLHCKHPFFTLYNISRDELSSEQVLTRLLFNKANFNPCNIHQTCKYDCLYSPQRQNKREKKQLTLETTLALRNFNHLLPFSAVFVIVTRFRIVVE